MCGIAGYLDLDGQRPAVAPILDAMCAALAHRGPDDDGQFLDGALGLGFRRLSIVDLRSGQQPMTNEDGSVVLVCNGEIYNAPELRADLRKRGHCFRSQCDVEVLLHLYEEEGVDFVHRLNGQFAAAIYDRRQRRLVLARDPFGICPLYYTVVDRTLVFASEIKAILRHPAIERRVDPTGLDQILTFPGLISPTSMFDGIRSLPNGHRAIVADGTVRVEEYWDLIYPHADTPTPHVSESEWIEQLDALLDASVRRRLQSDVPVGLYLSGGLDSSLIAALVARASPGTQRRAFSITFPRREMDESVHQAIVAQHVGVEHHGIHFDWPEIVQRFSTMIRHAECPLKESYNTCSLALSEAARAAGVPVVLSGEGADELFAGYIGYRFDRFGHPVAAMEDFLEAEMEAELRERLWGSPLMVYETNHLAFRDIKAALYAPALSAQYEAFDCLERPIVNRDRLTGRHPIHQRSYLDFKLRLVDHLVSDHGDRMAMANSVEARFPFLDLDLVKFAVTVPPDLKLNGWQEKYLIKRVADGKVPDAIVKREKFGFHGPGSPYLLRHAREWVEDILSFSRISRQGYFNPHSIEALKKRYLEDGFHLNLPFETDVLFTVLSFGVFLDEFGMPDFS
ncbi:asparagine synthase (glutamine-hydrolyzing) [Dyella subtropica]|uniref:asparagine synthase (glutamine-hydrolyzing) n=1 Tax=Dyella subtropica TaxID=2992127 RepID=UPI00224DFF8D|nr:asparagine synthase (glutamine-hydrolyzing) [Dyella subtropica]